jgi:hypothetical protein
MKKALMEDKRDLEKGAFKAGSAAGNVEGALDFLRSFAAREPAARRAILEGACLVSAADGDVDPAERDAIGRLAALLDVDDDAWIDECLVDLATAASTEDIVIHADRIGAALRDTSCAAEGVGAAAAVGLISEGMSLGELSVLRRLANGSGLPEDMLGAIVDGADQALSKA